MVHTWPKTKSCKIQYLILSLMAWLLVRLVVADMGGNISGKWTSRMIKKNKKQQDDKTNEWRVKFLLLHIRNIEWFVCLVHIVTIDMKHYDQWNKAPIWKEDWYDSHNSQWRPSWNAFVAFICCQYNNADDKINFHHDYCQDWQH